MAKCKCKVRISGFEPNKGGYAAVMNGSACQGIVRDHAEATLDAADGMLTPDNYTSAKHRGHKLGVAHGKLANGYYVRTYTNHAKRSTLRHNTLKKALQ